MFPFPLINMCTLQSLDNIEKNKEWQLNMEEHYIAQLHN